MIEFENQYTHNTAWEKISPIFFRDFRFSLSPRSPNIIIVTFEDVPIIHKKRGRFSLLKVFDKIFGVDTDALDATGWTHCYPFYFVAADGKIRVCIENISSAIVFVEVLYPLLKLHDIDLVLVQGAEVEVPDWEWFQYTIKGEAIA